VGDARIRRDARRHGAAVIVRRPFRRSSGRCHGRCAQGRQGDPDAAGRSVAVDYTPPPTGGLANAAGGPVAAFTGQSVTDNTPPPPTDGGSYSPTLARPPFATDTPATVKQLSAPHVGEWTFPLQQFYFPSHGTLRGLAIFVDFPGAKLNVDPQTYLDTYVPRAQEWFREASNGRFGLQLDRAPHTYSMPRTIADYKLNGGADYATLRQAFTDAVALADPDVDFRNYDAVWIFGAAGAMTYTIWRPFSGAAVTADGKEIKFGIAGGVDPADYRSPVNPLTPEQAKERVSNDVFTHEIGHILGLQDLYQKQPDFSNTFDPVGGWDMMSETTPGPYYLVWNKWLLGWVDPSQLRGVTAPGTVEYTLTPTETAVGIKGIVVPTSATSTYVIEARRKLGFDARLCDEGVLVYTVDSTKRNAEGAIDIKPARQGSDPYCGLKAFAGWDVGQSYDDSFLRVDVLSADATGSYRVRVTRK